jgi:hypothetical protein
VEIEKRMVEHADPTQLRLAVRRLELFLEHLGNVHAFRPVTGAKPVRGEVLAESESGHAAGRADADSSTSAEVAKPQVDPAAPRRSRARKSE